MSKRGVTIVAIIAIFVALLVVAMVTYVRRFNNIGKYDLAERLSVCGLSDKEGQMISISQGTVGSVSGGIRIGLRSVRDGEANLVIWSEESNTTSPTLTLGRCGSANFAGREFYVIDVADRPDMSFGRTGSGADSVDILIRQ